jgi:hypothetical protein
VEIELVMGERMEEDVDEDKTKLLPQYSYHENVIVAHLALEERKTTESIEARKAAERIRIEELKSEERIRKEELNSTERIEELKATVRLAELNGEAEVRQERAKCQAILRNKDSTHDEKASARKVLKLNGSWIEGVLYWLGCISFSFIY